MIVMAFLVEIVGTVAIVFGIFLLVKAAWKWYKLVNFVKGSEPPDEAS